MPKNEWVRNAAADVQQYATHMDQYDAAALAEDLQRSWPGLAPADAVRFFFQPLPPSGTAELA